MKMVFKRFFEFLKESSKSTYEYGCAMLYFDFPEMKEIHEKINEDDIYIEEGDNTYGLEDEPHCTLLYGLHEEVKPEQIKKIVGEFAFGSCKIHNASLFENDKYDVLKFDVDGGELHECNEDLTKLPHTNSFPDYHPHMTIAYLKPGKGKEYVEKLKGIEFNLSPSHAVFSQPNGTKTKFPVNKFKK